MSQAHVAYSIAKPVQNQEAQVRLSKDRDHSLRLSSIRPIEC